MARALELGELGRGYVSPNPMVGCVIVHGDKIIGEGFHQKCGGPHAEVNAINRVKEKDLLKDSTMYVTLEPCSHFGKTPPCADLIARNKLHRVVIATKDPNPEVNGNGIKILKQAGIEVIEGVLEKRSVELNRRFNTFHRRQRPYIILKWAQTGDGFLAREDFASKWISNKYSRQMVHKWRTEEDAVLVGKNTLKYDNPSLTARDWKGNNPVRIALDPNLEVRSSDLNLLDGTARTLIFNYLQDKAGKSAEYIKVDPDKTILQICDELCQRNIQSVIVEGGSLTISRFIESDLWDEARVFESEVRFEKGIPAPKLQMNPSGIKSVLNDQLYYYENGNH